MLTAELNRSRTIGCEFEFVLPQLSSADHSDVRRVFAEILTANGLPAVARSYSHDAVPHGADWAVEYDSSVSGPSDIRGLKFVSLEIKTRILKGMDDWERVVPKALAIASYLGGRAGHASCGHHVHVGVEEVKVDPHVVRSIVNLVQRYEPLILGLVAPSRRNNSFAQALPTQTGMAAACRTIEQYRQMLQSVPRNSGLNLTHLWGANPRLEFRWHQGTLDAEKARHWSRFLLRLTDHAAMRTCKTAKEQLVNDRANLNRMLTTIGLKVNTRVYAKVDPELRATGRFLLRRWKHFNQQQPGAARSRPTSAPNGEDSGVPNLGVVRPPPPAH